MKAAISESNVDSMQSAPAPIDQPGDAGLAVGPCDSDEGQRLYDAAGMPKKLRYSNGRHVQPGRSEIIGELLAIADEETPFLVNGM